MKARLNPRGAYLVQMGQHETLSPPSLLVARWRRSHTRAQHWYSARMTAKTIGNWAGLLERLRMENLSVDGRRLLQDIAERNRVSLEAVTTLLQALALGNGTQAQFNHPDLGGMGQWSQGGMVMVGDMFNHGLKARVDSLCKELSLLLRDKALPFEGPSSSQSQFQGVAGTSLFVPGSPSSNRWWPSELGSPDSTGSQNDLRYAWFSAPRRLAIKHGGQVQVYDTGDHMISGFSQQQGGGQSLTFTSNHGLVRVSELPLVDTQHHHSAEAPEAPDQNARTPAEQEQRLPPEAVQARQSSQPSSAASRMGAPSPQSIGTEDIFSKIERLSELHEKGIVTDQEFSAKKAELLARI